MEASSVLETFLQFHQTAFARIGEDWDYDNEELSKLQKKNYTLVNFYKLYIRKKLHDRVG